MNSEFHTRRIQTRRLTFSALELGEGPLVLALHGFPDLPRTFRYQMQALAAAGYRVVAPYMPGYHPTEFSRNGRYEPAAIALDCLALLNALTDQPVILIGHDWGALAAPEKIARLITIAVPQPGVLTTAIHYYRHAFNPSDDPELAVIQERQGSPILVPSLYLHGAEDGGIGAEVTEGMEEHFPRGLEKRILSGAGHFVHQEKAGEVNRLVLTFLQS